MSLCLLHRGGWSPQYFTFSLGLCQLVRVSLLSVPEKSSLHKSQNHKCSVSWRTLTTTPSFHSAKPLLLRLPALLQCQEIILIKFVKLMKTPSAPAEDTWGPRLVADMPLRMGWAPCNAWGCAYYRQTLDLIKLLIVSIYLVSDLIIFFLNCATRRHFHVNINF